MSVQSPSILFSLSLTNHSHMWLYTSSLPNFWFVLWWTLYWWSVGGGRFRGRHSLAPRLIPFLRALGTCETQAHVKWERLGNEATSSTPSLSLCPIPLQLCHLSKNHTHMYYLPLAPPSSHFCGLFLLLPTSTYLYPSSRPGPPLPLACVA